MKRRGIHNHRAYSLIELTVSIAVAGVIMVGLGSTVLLASRAIPDPEHPRQAARASYLVLEQMAGELLCAQNFTERTAKSVEFTVADRDKDLSPEVIRYDWSGTAGDGLTRKYNDDLAVTIAEDVYEFGLTYGLATLSETTTEETSTWSAQDLLAYFDGWVGVTPTAQTGLLGPGYLYSEYLEIIPPAGVSQLKITRADVVLSSLGSPPDAVQVEVRRSLQDGSFEPAAVRLGTPATIFGALLTASPTWHVAGFSDVVISDLDRTDYCLVVSVSGTTPAYSNYYYSKSAPADGMYLKWTDDGGSTWNPASKVINQYDLRFRLYGSYLTTGMGEVTVERYFVTSVRMAVRIGSDSTTRLETTVQALNQPEVATP